MKHNIDIIYANGIHIRLKRSRGSNNLQIIIYDNKGKPLIKGPFLSPETTMRNLIDISKAESLDLYIK